MNDMSIEYLAGFFDGEGCIWAKDRGVNERGVLRRPNFRLYLIQTGMEGRDVLQLIAKEYGGTCNERTRQKKRYKRVWHWFMTGERAYKLASLLAPHLKVKRKKTEELLARYSETFLRPRMFADKDSAYLSLCLDLLTRERRPMHIKELLSMIASNFGRRAKLASLHGILHRAFRAGLVRRPSPATYLAQETVSLTRAIPASNST